MNKKSKVLLYDIETSPLVGYTWGMYEQNVIRVQKEWYMLSFAYKWLGEKTTHVMSLPNFKGYASDKSNDKLLVKELWKLMDEADVIVAHYGDAFDIKKSNARFVYHGLTPPSPYKTVDTKKVASRYFKFTSNKLDDLGQHLGLGKKEEHSGFDTWLGCMNGEEKSWREMCKYNKQDVVLLEKVYLRLLPWMTNHPRTTDNPISVSCANCGSNRLQRRGFIRNKVSTLQRLHCQSCGAWGTTKIEKNND